MYGVYLKVVDDPGDNKLESLQDILKHMIGHTIILRDLIKIAKEIPVEEYVDINVYRISHSQTSSRAHSLISDMSDTFRDVSYKFLDACALEENQQTSSDIKTYIVKILDLQLELFYILESSKNCAKIQEFLRDNKRALELKLI